MIDECRENVTFRIVTILTSYLKTLKCLFNGRYSRLQGLGDLWFRMGVSDSTFTAHTHTVDADTTHRWHLRSTYWLHPALQLTPQYLPAHAPHKLTVLSLCLTQCLLLFRMPFSQSTACLDLCRIQMWTHSESLVYQLEMQMRPINIQPLVFPNTCTFLIYTRPSVYCREIVVIWNIHISPGCLKHWNWDYRSIN